MKPETWISLSALLVAVLSAVASVWVSRRQAGAQDRLLALEQARDDAERIAARTARLRAHIYDGGDRGHRLVVQNSGVAAARSVDVTIDGVDLLTSDRVVGVGRPVKTLGADAGVEFYLHTYMGSDPVYSIRLAWQDESGMPGVWESELRI